MPRYPAALWLPMNKATTYGKRAVTDAAILHVAAGESNSLLGWWNNADSGANGCHFYVRYDGTVEQYADTDYITWTSGSGSRRSVGIETQGLASGEWTQQQLDSLVALLDWLCGLYSIPREPMTSSAIGERGIGWHRLGVPKFKGATISRTNGETWAADYSKVCPGPDREKQIPALVASLSTATIGKPIARPDVATPTTPPTATTPPVAPRTPMEDPMLGSLLFVGVSGPQADHVGIWLIDARKGTRTHLTGPQWDTWQRAGARLANEGTKGIALDELDRTIIPALKG